MRDKIEKNLIEVELLKSVDDVREILTRLGIGNNHKKVLYQSCELLGIGTKYYIAHFKELFELLGNSGEWREGDIERRNKISTLMEEWGVIRILNKQEMLLSWDLDINYDTTDIKVFTLGKRFVNEWSLVKMFNPKLMEKLKEKISDELEL